MRLLRFKKQKLLRKSYLYKNLAYESVLEQNKQEVEVLQGKIEKIAAGEPLEPKMTEEEFRVFNLKEKEN